MVITTQLNLPDCNKCKRNIAVYKRNYSGEILCKSCFTKSIEEKVRKTLSKFSMVQYGDRIAVAVSGGKDSLTLLYILNKILDGNARNRLTAITVDEGIEGYRDESLQIVKDFCSRLKIESRVLSFRESFGIGMDEALLLRSSQKISSCSICGTFRRRAIDMLSESCGVNVVATAHNLDDHIQSFFINTFSGDTARIGWSYPEPVEYGLHGIKKVKPFIGLYEQEIVFYALHHEIPFQSAECPYMHESIRTELRKFLNNLEDSHPGIKYNIYNSVLKVSEGLRNQRSVKRYTNCSVCERQSTSEICSVCHTQRILFKEKIDD
jgi:cytoplasmic tRNA 2-thiolation protein 1